MSEGLTPERRAKAERLIESYDNRQLIHGGEPTALAFMDEGFPQELLAEIDRLNKVVDQAIYRLGPTALDMGASDLEDVPELAAELQRRGK